MKEFKLTPEEKEAIILQAKEDIIQDRVEYEGMVHNGSSLASIIEDADEMLKNHTNLTYEDIEVNAWEQPVEWEDYTDIVMGLRCPSQTPDALEQRIKHLEERALFSKKSRYENWLDLNKEFGGKE